MDNIKLVTSFEKNAENLSTPVEKDINGKQSVENIKHTYLLDLEKHFVPSFKKKF
jgi:hypothetical protein